MKLIKKAVAITDAKISFVSLVDKGANKREFLITKAKDGGGNFITMGKILKSDSEYHTITGVVYEPMDEDAHGNYMTEEEIVKASYWFAENGDKVDLQHNFEECPACSVVENWVTKSDETIGDTIVPKGTWLITVKVSDTDIWEKVEKKEITGLSMGGVGRYSTTDDNITDIKKGGNIAMEQQNEKKGIFKKLAEAFGTVGFDLVEKGDMSQEYGKKQKSTGFWNAVDTLTSLLSGGYYDYSKDKYIYDFEANEQQIRDVLLEFSEIITNLLTSESIVKAISTNAPDKPIAKAGKKMSGKNKEKLDGICRAISEFQKEFDNNNDEEEKEVKKEDIAKIVDEAIAKAVATAQPKPPEAPEEIEMTAESLQKMIEAAVAKSVANSTPAPVPEADDLATMIDNAVSKALEPLLKARGLPSNLSDNLAPLQKSDKHYLAGII